MSHYVVDLHLLFSIFINWLQQNVFPKGDMAFNARIRQSMCSSYCAKVLSVTLLFALQFTFVGI